MLSLYPLINLYSLFEINIFLNLFVNMITMIGILLSKCVEVLA